MTPVHIITVTDGRLLFNFDENSKRIYGVVHRVDEKIYFLSRCGTYVLHQHQYFKLIFGASSCPTILALDRFFSF